MGCNTLAARQYCQEDLPWGIRDVIGALGKPELTLNTIQIEGITKQNGLKEIFEHDPFNFV